MFASLIDQKTAGCVAQRIRKRNIIEKYLIAIKLFIIGSVHTFTAKLKIHAFEIFEK